MRCTHYLVIILLLIAQTSFGQIYQNMAQPGYKFSRARFDSVLTIPTGLGNLKNITGGQDTGQIRFNVSDSSVYVWNGRAFIKAGGGVSDTLKVSVSDTAAMLANYAKTAAVNLKLNISDTATMLTNYAKTAALALKVNISDTASMLSNYAKTAAVNLKLNIADTATMLSAYARSAAVTSSLALKLNISDTATMLTPYARTSALATKLNISDTAAMLSPYSRVTVSSYGKNAGGDSTILLLSNGTRFAARDSVGGGGATQWVNTANGIKYENRLVEIIADSIGTVPNDLKGLNLVTPTNATVGSPQQFSPQINFRAKTFAAGVGNVERKFRIFSKVSSGDNKSMLMFQRENSGSYEEVLGVGQNKDGSSERSINVSDKGYFGGGSTIGTDINNMAFVRGFFGSRFRDEGGVSAQFSAAGFGSFINTGTALGLAISANSSLNSVASAMLEINSTTKGVLFPRMTTTQRNAIASPATGLQVYNTTNNTPNYYTGTSFANMGGSVYKTAVQVVGTSENLVSGKIREVKRLIFRGTTGASGIATIPLTGFSPELILSLTGTFNLDASNIVPLNYSTATMSDGELNSTNIAAVYKPATNSIQLTAIQNFFGATAINGAFTIIIEFQEN